jgi:hypothetical protein
VFYGPDLFGAFSFAREADLSALQRQKTESKNILF